MSNGLLEDKDKYELTMRISEYESLRQESMNSINNRVQIMVFGMAAIGALVGGSLTIDDPAKSPYLIYSIFSIAIPLICIYIFFVWASEAMRSHRVGYFIASEVEPGINKILGRSVMTWEISLWKGRLPRDEMYGPSMMAMTILAYLH